MKKKLSLIVIFVLCVSFLCITAGAKEKGSTDQRVVSLSVQTYPNKTVYGAFECFDANGLRLKAVYDSGEERIVGSDLVEVSYQSDDCFRVGDSGVILSYGGKGVVLPVTVNRISYDLSALLLEDISVTYNGKYQSYGEMLPDIIGLDGIPLIMSAVGGSINTGTYDIKIDFFSESRDYVVPDTRIISMKILPLEVKLFWSDSTFVYDGKSKLPEAYYYDVSGKKIYPTVTGASINAGKYTAVAVVGDSNYKLIGESQGYEIKKADYDFSSVVWSKDSFIYDGSKKSITVSGLPDGVSVIGYSSDRATNAGIYTVTASLSYDEKNYNAPTELSHIWEIKKAEYDMLMTEFVDTEWVFDGEVHYPRLEGRMPTGADGIKLECEYSAGAIHVSDGVVVVTVNFTTKSKNYNLPSSQTATVRIIPCGIYVKWGEISLSYNGENQLPTVSSDKCEISLKGGGENVGKYTAIASTKDRDYYIINDRIDFEIKQAVNSWITEPQSTTCYEGKKITLNAEAKFGRPQYVFYADKDGKERISTPSSPGVYYVKIFVPETDNYGGIESKIIAFEIVEIMAVSFSATIERKNIKAYEKLSAEDFACFITNNDGSTLKIDSSLVSVIYESADSFRRSDSNVYLSYDGFKISVSVSVDYADYDLSGVVWVNTSTEYDGREKSPYISGLPEGITVVEYVGAGAVDAGKYIVSAVVRYDGENYNEPDIPECIFEIRRCVIAPPIIKSEYNGDDQYPISDSTLYTVEYDGVYRNAGQYDIVARLTDPANYCFSGSEGESCTATYLITPKSVNITVKDINKYLFEKIGQAEYSIQVDQLIPGDEITVAQYTVEEYVFYRSTNPNYTLSVTPGKIHRLFYPSLRGILVILLAVAIICLVIAAVFAIYTFRHRIISAFAVLRCRWHNRTVLNLPPKDASVDKSIDPDYHQLDEVEDNYLGEEDSSDNAEYGDEEEYSATVENEYQSLNEYGEQEIPTVALEVDVERANELITDSLAKSLIKKEGDCVYTYGNVKSIINVDTISDSFAQGDRVDVNSLKEKGLVTPDTAYIKVLARGSIDKALSVYANDFSLSAVKMIALTGGEAKKVITVREKEREE